MKDGLNHFDEKTERAKMVDVAAKKDSARVAVARTIMRISKPLTAILLSGKLKKGDAFTVAKTAGILAAKQTGNFIPMCHPLFLDCVNINIVLLPKQNEVHIEAEVKTTAKTGVEMEALMAASVTAMTIYDMCKAVDKKILLLKTGLYKKKGGKSGVFINPDLDWA